MISDTGSRYKGPGSRYWSRGGVGGTGGTLKLVGHKSHLSLHDELDGDPCSFNYEIWRQKVADKLIYWSLSGGQQIICLSI